MYTRVPQKPISGQRQRAAQGYQTYLFLVPAAAARRLCRRRHSRDRGLCARARVQPVRHFQGVTSL